LSYFILDTASVFALTSLHRTCLTDSDMRKVFEEAPDR